MKGAKATLQAIDGGLKGLPPMPASIPTDMADEWTTCGREMLTRNIFNPSAAGVLETYIIARWTVRECQKALAEHGPLTKSAHGMLKPNPAAGIMSKANETVARLAAELGLTPAARAKQGFNPKGGKRDQGAPPDLDI
jgi:P27 family predicted phage terminase small subunit